MYHGSLVRCSCLLLLLIVTVYSQEETNCTESQLTCKETEDATVCSDRGNCTCGECVCNTRDDAQEIVSGKYCECDNFSCAKNVDGSLCSSHGNCVCGKCSCEDGFSGQSCDCSADTAGCLNQETSEICSNHGSCQCGACKCEENWEGEQCQSCPTCQRSCSEYELCVQCRLQPENEADSCLEQCGTITLVKVEQLNDELQENEKSCETSDAESGCTYSFTVASDGSVNALETPECPASTTIPAPVEVRTTSAPVSTSESTTESTTTPAATTTAEVETTSAAEPTTPPTTTPTTEETVTVAAITTAPLNTDKSQKLSASDEETETTDATLPVYNSAKAFVIVDNLAVIIASGVIYFTLA